MQELTFHTGFSTIIFDCDYTLTKIQGINELADSATSKDNTKLIHNLTMQVVSGKKTLEEVFAERISLARPSRQQLEEVGKKYIENVVKDAQIVVEALQYLGKKVYIMSHGYKTAVDPFAEFLNIPKENAFAVDIEFNSDGTYKNLNLDQPLVKSDGKRQIISQLGLVKNEILFIGDGPLDLDVKDNVGLFLGFGGVKEHAIVKKNTNFYLTSESLLPILFIATSPIEKNLLQATKYEEAMINSFIFTEKNLVIS